MAGALTESIISGVMGQNFEISDGTKEMARKVSREAAELVSSGIITDIVLAGIDPSGVSLVRVASKMGVLAWKAGAYLHHHSTLQTQLAVCLEEYCEAGYLTKSTASGDDKATVWQTTSVFREANIVLDIYPDIKQYLNDQAFTEAEKTKIGIYSNVSLYADSNKVNDLEHRLSACCARAGVKDITKTDAEKRIANVSFVQMGAIALQNAFIAEGERRERGDEPAVVPVLGRILGIAAVCGLTEITIAEITTILGKAPIFETVARARIAKLRKQHASHIFNGLLFGGSTESAGQMFEHIAAGDRVVVGHVKDIGKSEFLDEYASPRCELSGPVEKNHEVGKPIYMMAGWAHLIKHRELIEKQHGAITQMAHLHSPTKACDVHGNSYMSAGKLSKIVFTVKELADGPLMAKPHKFGRFDYNSKADFKKGSILVDAMGEEKLFGGIVGPVACPCKGGLAEANAKGQLIKGWKLGKGLKICSREFVGNSISHTNNMSTKKISILWRPGDWAMGCFFMQTLPQSSYLQGRGQCLHCAVEGAALAGCPEVIACGGGKVSIEAFEHERQKAVMEGQRPISTPLNVVPGSPTSTLSSPVTGVFTPPPPYSSPQGSPQLAQVDYFAISDANGDKIVPANIVTSIADQVPRTGIMLIDEKFDRDRIVPSKNITQTGNNIVPAGTTMSSGDQIVPTKEIMSIGDKIAPTKKDEVIATYDLISFSDQGTTEDLISFGDQGTTEDLLSFGDQGAPNDLLSLGDQGATNDIMLTGAQVITNGMMSIGDQAATNDSILIGDKVATNDITSIGDQVATNEIVSINDQAATDGIIPINDKLTPNKQVRFEDETVTTDDLMLIDDQAATDDITSIGGQVATNEIVSIDDQAATNGIMPINDKLTPNKQVRSEDETVTINDLMLIDDQAATDDITSIGDKVGADNITSIGGRVAIDVIKSFGAQNILDIASVADPLVPSIDIKSFAAKIGNHITRKASGTKTSLSGSISKPEKETATALYDFQVQVEGHLTFKRGDVIRILKIPEDENEWWTGEWNGKQGIFPGNHVSLGSAKNPTAETLTGKAVATSKRLGLTAAVASKKLGSTATAASRKLGSTAVAASKKLGSTAAATSEELESTAAADSKKPESTATATAKKLESTATADSKKPESTATATVKKPESTATATAKKPDSTAAATSEELESIAAVTTKKPESTAAADSKKPESIAAADSKKPESTAAADSKKLESTAAADSKKPESTAAADSKKPESTAAADSKKPESTAAADSKKPESTAAADSKKPESTAAADSKKPESTAAATSKKLGLTVAATSKKLGSTATATSKKLGLTATATSKKLGSTATATSKKLGSTARWFKKGYADISRIAGRNDAQGLENAEIGSSDNVSADNATVDDATANDATVENATVDNATVDDATANDTTVDNATVDDATANDTTVDNATVDNATVDDATVDDATVDNATVDNATVDDATANDATVDNATVDNATVDDATVDDGTADDTLVDDATANDATADDAIADDASVDDATVDDALVDDASVEDATVDNALVDNALVDDASVEDATVDNALVDDASVNDAMVDDTLVDDASVDDFLIEDF